MGRGSLGRVLLLQVSSHLVPSLLQESSHLVPLLLQESSLHFLVFLLKLFWFTLTSKASNDLYNVLYSKLKRDVVGGDCLVLPRPHYNS